jgi:hypothetical protein
MSDTEATSNENSFETFDSFEDGEISGESADESEEDWSKDEKEEAPQKSKPKDEGLKLLDDTDVDGEGKVVEKEDKEKREPKKARKEAEKEEVEEEYVKVEPSDNELPEDKKGKPLRIRMADGDLYNIDATSTVPVKVDGKNQEVPMQELINNYSGKTAWDKKFTELGKEKKAVEFEKAQVTTRNNLLTDHLNRALDPIKDPNKNPLDSMLYLVEMSGQDPYAAYRRIMEANLEELSSLMDMGETERELYFHKKKDELHGKVTKQRNERVTKDQAFNQAVEKVNALRQAHNVSEDDFVDASEELEESFKAQGLDADSITEEQVVDFASLRPHIVTVKELVEPYDDNIDPEKYGDVVAQLARYLRDGKTNKEGVIEILKRNYSVEEDVKELNTKVYQKNAAKPVSRKVEVESSEGESFDDWN